MKVWALFSIANEYDQPDNNLEKLWLDKPSFLQLVDTLYGRPVEELMDDEIIKAANLLKGERVCDGHHNEYRIEEVDVEE